MKRCPFAENEYCVEQNCSLWEDGCLVRQALIRYLGGENKIVPNDEEIKAKI